VKTEMVQRTEQTYLGKTGWLLGKVRSSPLSYGIAVLVVGLALLVKLLLDPLIEEESPFLLFFGAVIVSAWVGGLRVGLFAVALAALVVNYFFLSPPNTLWLDDFGQGLRLTLFVVEGASVSLLVAAISSAKRHAEVRPLQPRRDQENLWESEERFRLLVEGVSCW
jgi:K+-sensing histidine kinase KdpD